MDEVTGQAGDTPESVRCTSIVDIGEGQYIDSARIMAVIGNGPRTMVVAVNGRAKTSYVTSMPADEVVERWAEALFHWEIIKSLAKRDQGTAVMPPETPVRSRFVGQGIDAANH